jgi:hypothetical protein
MLSNAELIQAFVQQSCSNREVLLANSELRAEGVCGVNQLIAKGEGVIFTTHQMSKSLQFSAKFKSHHWNTMVGALAESGFLMVGDPNQQHFYTFQYYKMPKGYQPHCTESVMLWRSWWKHRKHILRAGVPTELFVRTRDTWYPIRNLFISDSVLFVQTFGSEIPFHISDLVVWLSKMSESTPAATSTH